MNLPDRFSLVHGEYASNVADEILRSIAKSHLGDGFGGIVESGLLLALARVQLARKNDASPRAIINETMDRLAELLATEVQTDLIKC